MRASAFALAVSLFCPSAVVTAGTLLAPNLLVGDSQLLDLDEAWPSVPEDRSPCLEDRISDNVTDYGNVVGYRLDEVSHHAARVRIDVRKQTAFLHLGYSDVISIDSNWLFTNGRAYIAATIDLNIHHHHWELALPEMDVTRDSYRNEAITELNVSVLEKRF